MGLMEREQTNVKSFITPEEFIEQAARKKEGNVPTQSKRRLAIKRAKEREMMKGRIG